jgi:2-haloacid dehalogenase
VPTAVFDLIGTLFRLDRVSDHFEARDLPPVAADLWVASSLRDYMAISVAEGFEPLAEVLAGRVATIYETFGRSASKDDATAALEALKQVEPDPGAHEGCDLLRGAGWRLVVLTNGSAALAGQLLDRHGLAGHMAAVLSCESIGAAKPDRRVYEMALAEAEGEAWMVASHAWDLYGAGAAGMSTAYVTQGGGDPPPVFPPPDVSGVDLAEVARALL